ncbi:Ig-like domain-containing protein, partial [Rhodococcus olei]|uniref:Ig-like domain-containing protein n=1 Tax=Rhodococcus olei TaxID=2161675 RepID=UPI0031E69B35
YGGSLGDGTYQNKGPTATVRKNASTATLAAVASAQSGQATTLSATVTGGADGDTVEFYDGATKIGTGTLAAGAATYSWTPTAGGAHALTAKYLGNAKTDGSTSAAQNVTVSVPDQATTTTVSGPATVTEGQSVTLTAQVAPTPAGGTIQFKDGDTALGSAATVGPDGKASVTVPSLNAGTHQVTAVYTGAAGFTGSTSAAFTVTVAAPDQATTTTLTAPATASEGQAVTLTAQVAPTPNGGTIQFKDGDTNLGAPEPVAANGSASISRALGLGSHQLTAVYSGAAGFIASVSDARTLTVSAVVPTDKATTTTLNVPGSAKTGQAVHLYATVTGPDNAPIGSVGTVEFTVDGQVLAPVNVVNGVADLPQTFATAGVKAVKARYSGGTGFSASVAQDGSVTVTDPNPSDVATTTVVTAPATAAKGSAVELTATVSPAPAGGTVQFFDGTTPIGGPVQVTGGKATLSHAFAQAGGRQITAVYSGAQGSLGSTSTAVTVTVTESGTGPVDPGDSGTGSLSSIFGS